MKILIVDDESPARERLKDLILDIGGGYELLEAGNGLEALRLAEEAQPDIVLLDIRMPVMDGLEAAHHMALLSSPPAVLFTTAYEEHALSAFDANAVDYLLKPIRAERLKTALERARVVRRAELDDIKTEGTLAATRSHISAVHQGKLRLIPVRDIRYLHADQKYVTVYWPDQEALIDESLKAIEDEFGDLFLRIHRNALVSVAHIEALEKDEEGNYEIVLRDAPRNLTVSRRHTRAVRDKLKELTRPKS
ncbi:MAG: LytTR family DNA-binding domain-containing protein [Gammaproteobacteria bacterium]